MITKHLTEKKAAAATSSVPGPSAGSLKKPVSNQKGGLKSMVKKTRKTYPKMVF